MPPFYFLGIGSCAMYCNFWIPENKMAAHTNNFFMSDNLAVSLPLKKIKSKIHRVWYILHNTGTYCIEAGRPSPILLDIYKYISDIFYIRLVHTVLRVVGYHRYFVIYINIHSPKKVKDIIFLGVFFIKL